MCWIVLEEALRIFPPAPPGGQRTVPPEGAYISDKWVPGGTQVKVPLYSAHRVSANWRDPDTFVPERWMGDEKYKDDNKGTFAPFSIGPRNCIGIKYVIVISHCNDGRADMGIAWHMLR
jgi:cytochrome P450